MPGRLIVYFPLADPCVSVEQIAVYADAGVDVVECGWPSYDPYLDGPGVRASMARAVGGDPAFALDCVRDALARSGAATQPLLMAYTGARHPPPPASLAGLYGVLAVAPAGDDDRARLETRARDAGVAVCAFTPLPLAQAEIDAAWAADGYVMLQAAPGLTGPRPSLEAANAERIAGLRAAGVTRPIVLGFGVSSGEQARAAIGLGADGVVVGSAALRAAIQGPAVLATLLRELRRGLDG